MPRPRSPLAAIVLAAGKGTRMKSSRAKVLHPLLGRPLAYYPVKRALELGADPVVIVVGHQAEAVEAALRAALPDAPLRFALQARQLGTADAVRVARPALRGHKGPVLILYGDTPLLEVETLRAVLASRARMRAPVSIGTMVPASPHGYGRVIRDQRGRPVRVVEEKDASEAERAITEVNAGLYCAEADFLWRSLSRIGAQNAQRELYLPDLVAMAAARSRVAAALLPAADAAGVNDRAELARAGRTLIERLAQRFAREGVTIEDPARFDCDEGVEIARDVVIEPDVRLRGRTRIGSGTVIGAGCILTDAVVGEEVTLKPYCVVEEASISRAAVIGPFARIRPGSDIGEGAHVGNFVETKKVHLGKGSKANHLTYLGDAEVGEGVNVGAGTITCNYDGEKKHPTRIGDGAFIGSDSILVAPIEIGAGAYVGAGSTLTESVPPGALAIGRARQVTKEGWVARLKQIRTARNRVSASRPSRSPRRRKRAKKA
ncbi:MAG TPA: bifunctional UDP-N-acetylglucosamine diphosphorylase/glucosamine-1-phosphate N-acetyltransferase GlmU [Anaeromyxobacter sp.]|nr:bifunctional UDP-N-acetylglucosamine diphosphorylase/glucosamine-1-phosphate N-acetyltransferase GlmU [Anaeromyxobacter sp.]